MKDPDKPGSIIPLIPIIPQMKTKIGLAFDSAGVIKLRDIAVYKPGMHSTTQTELVVKFWGDGSYLDNVSKKDKERMEMDSLINSHICEMSEGMLSLSHVG